MASRKVSKKKKKQTKNSTEKPILPYLLIGLAITVTIIVTLEINSHLQKGTLHEVETNCDWCNDATVSMQSKDSFRDYNPQHLEHAQKNGIKTPFKTNDDLLNQIDTYLQAGTLVEISNNKYYSLHDLSYSFPYLTPEAAQLLEDIGRRFHARLKEKDLPKYKFELSSLLRTEETQRKLMHINRNATPNGTAHYYGTTFDIAYDKYERNGTRYQDNKVETIMKEVLLEMRKECRFLIIKEPRDKCFHITVVKCKNN